MPWRGPQRMSGVLRIIGPQAGFSLIEMILVLVLLGVMGVGAGFGISTVVNGFLFSRDSVATAAKGQLALLRLSREFRVITAVTNASVSSIQFTALHGDGVTQSYTVTQNGNTITVNDGVNNDILVDQVNSLTLAYYDTYNGAAQTTWSSARKIIQATIALNGPDGTILSFSTRVTPRNL